MTRTRVRDMDPDQQEAHRERLARKRKATRMRNEADQLLRQVTQAGYVADPQKDQWLQLQAEQLRMRADSLEGVNTE